MVIELTTYTHPNVFISTDRFLDDFIAAKQSVSNYRKVQYIHIYNDVGLFHSVITQINLYTHENSVSTTKPCSTAMLGYEILT